MRPFSSKSKREAHPEGFRLSNLSLVMVMAILGTGILLDGKLYNRTPAQTAIHALGEEQSVELQYAGEQILGFDKINNNWQQSFPLPAPVKSQRVQVLLDTNKYSQRKYLSLIHI